MIWAWFGYLFLFTLAGILFMTRLFSEHWIFVSFATLVIMEYVILTRKSNLKTSSGFKKERRRQATLAFFLSLVPVINVLATLYFIGANLPNNQKQQ